MKHLMVTGQAEQGMFRKSRNGDGWLTDIAIVSSTAGDAAGTIDVSMIKAGAVLRPSGPTAGRTDTLPTATVLDAAFPGMEIGDCIPFTYLNRTSQTITIAGDTGNTLSPATTIATNTNKQFIITKTAASTYITYAAS